jgi:predicted MPP superfamily phosphohydrolase
MPPTGVARRGAFVAAAALLVGLAAWGLWIEPASLRVVETRLAVPGWPAADAGLRVALLSDFHVGSPHNGPEKLRAIVRRTNAANPDIILLAGDYVSRGVPGGQFVPPEVTEEIVRGFRAPLGVYAVLGNHDFAFNAWRVTRALQRAGIRVLNDEAYRVPPADPGRPIAPHYGPGDEPTIPTPPDPAASHPGRGLVPFWIVGVTDILRGPHDLTGALAQVTDGAPILLLTHNPDLFPEVPDGVALTLAGHTHGGQIRVPLLGRPVVPSMYGERYAAGLVIEHGRHLFVTTGLGLSILPVRIGVPPEIALLTLVPEEPRGR